MDAGEQSVEQVGDLANDWDRPDNDPQDLHRLVSRWPRLVDEHETA